MKKYNLKIGESVIVKAKNNSTITVTLSIGDEILAGKFKSKRAVIEGFSTDDHGQPVVKTNKGDFSVLKFRLVKLMPK